MHLPFECFVRHLTRLWKLPFCRTRHVRTHTSLRGTLIFASILFSRQGKSSTTGIPSTDIPVPYACSHARHFAHTVRGTTAGSRPLSFPLLLLFFFSSLDRMEIAQSVGRDAVTWPQIATRRSDDLLFPTSLFRVRRKFVFIATWIVRDARKSLARRPYRVLSKQSDRTSKHARFINAFFAHRVIVVPVQLIYRGLT